MNEKIRNAFRSIFDTFGDIPAGEFKSGGFVKKDEPEARVTGKKVDTVWYDEVSDLRPRSLPLSTSDFESIVKKADLEPSLAERLKDMKKVSGPEMRDHMLDTMRAAFETRMKADIERGIIPGPKAGETIIAAKLTPWTVTEGTISADKIGADFPPHTSDPYFKSNPWLDGPNPDLYTRPKNPEIDWAVWEAMNRTPEQRAEVERKAREEALAAQLDLIELEEDGFGAW